MRTFAYFVVLAIITVIFASLLVDKSNDIYEQYEQMAQQKKIIQNQQSKIKEMKQDIEDLDERLELNHEQLLEQKNEINELKKLIPLNRPTSTSALPSRGGFYKEMTVTATAYTAYCKGCSGVTFTGVNLRKNPQQKVIAVDPTVIPLGAKVWVEGYGVAFAEDIGGQIKGMRIDVFIPSHEEAMEWGKRRVKIKVYPQ